MQKQKQKKSEIIFGFLGILASQNVAKNCLC